MSRHLNKLENELKDLEKSMIYVQSAFEDLKQDVEEITDKLDEINCIIDNGKNDKEKIEDILSVLVR